MPPKGNVLAPSTPFVMVSITTVECESFPEVPVTVIEKVPRGLELVVDTFSVEDPVLPEVSATLVGFSTAVTPVAAGGTEEERLTVPENPRLVSEIVKLDEPPGAMVAAVGDALIVKSGRT
jgi:hypothetical protein